MPSLCSMPAQWTSLRSPSVPSGVDHHLGHEEHRDALGAQRRAGEPRQHEVDDVRRHVVLAERDENLLALDQVVVALGHGLRAHLGEVGTGLGLGQAHRAGPLAADQLLGVGGLLRVRTEQLERLDRTLIETRAVGEADVGGVPHLAGRAEQELRQTLAAVLGGHGQPDPAGLGELRVGFFEALGRRHDAVFPGAALAVAALVERVENFRRERRRLFEDRVDHVGGVLVAGQLADLLEAGEFAQNELHVAQGRAVGAHQCSSSSVRGSVAVEIEAELLQRFDQIGQVR